MRVLQVVRELLATKSVDKVPRHLNHGKGGQQNRKLRQGRAISVDELRKEGSRKKHGLGVAGCHHGALAVQRPGAVAGRRRGLRVGRRLLHRCAPAQDAKICQIGRTHQAQHIKDCRKSLQQSAQACGRHTHHHQQRAHAAGHGGHGGPHAKARAAAHHQHHVGAGRGRHHKGHAEKQPPGRNVHVKKPWSQQRLRPCGQECPRAAAPLRPTAGR